jgi:hypothetical protein
VSARPARGARARPPARSLARLPARSRPALPPASPTRPPLARPYPAGITVHVHGFVSAIHELMGAADAIVTKAGPGTIMEALICGLPMVLNAFVPCQEEGNIP